VVVAKLSRLSRAGVADALRLCEEVYEAGGEVVAIDVGIDPTTPTGKFTRTLMLALNEMELDRTKEGFLASRERAVERGAFVGPTPLGFDRAEINARTGKPCGALVHNADAPLVREAFVISGRDGLDSAVVFLKKTWPHRHWTVRAARKLFASRVYRGDVISGQFVNVGAHEPIVDEATWDAAQHPSTGGPRRSVKGTFPLSGIARCEACGGPIVGHWSGHKGKTKKRAYRCTAPGCTERPHALADPLEKLALDEIREATERDPVKTPPMSWYHNEISRARVALERYLADDETRTIVGDDIYYAELRERQSVYQQAQANADEAREASRDLPDLADPTPAELRTIFERSITAMTVRRTRIASGGQSEVLPAGTSSLNIRQGLRESLADRVDILI